MKNKQAKQSARDVYSDVYMNAEINSGRYHWAFDKLRNTETSWNRHPDFMRHKELDVVSIKAGNQ